MYCPGSQNDSREKRIVDGSGDVEWLNVGCYGAKLFAKCCSDARQRSRPRPDEPRMDLQAGPQRAAYQVRDDLMRHPWIDNRHRLATSHQEARRNVMRSEEHTSELQSLMRISYAVFCLKKKKNQTHLHESR